VNMATGALSALRRLSIVIAVAIVFVFGLGTTVYLSLRSQEVKVPDVLGKDRLEAERILEDADLNFRVRAFRPNSELKTDTVLFQLPRPGEVVKAGQTVAMDLSRTVKEGESSESVTPKIRPRISPTKRSTRILTRLRRMKTNRSASLRIRTQTKTLTARIETLTVTPMLTGRHRTETPIQETRIRPLTRVQIGPA